MLTDYEIGSLLERINPVLDPNTLPEQGLQLWASLDAKRPVPTAVSSRPRLRLRAVLVAVGLMMLVAVPAVASLLDQDAPPLDREFGTAENPLLSVYGSAEGLPDGCAWRLAFMKGGGPLVGGGCGVFELNDTGWDLIVSDTGVGLSLTDLAADSGGGIWVASPDQPLRRITGDGVVEMEIVSPWIAAAPDGTVWAVDYGPTSRFELVGYSEGSWRHIEGAEMVHDLAVGPDGTVWILSGNHLGRVSDDVVELLDVERPEGSLDAIAVAPDGAVWLVVTAAEEVVDREGVSDSLNYFVRYDGISSATIEVPFAEVSDLAMHPDGTLWASSSLHGVFFFDGERWTRFGPDDGMPADGVSSLEVAPDGTIYATTGGVVRINLAD